jgi:non-ribosomal peptide synthetase component F
MQKLTGIDDSWRPVLLERKGARAELELEVVEAENSIEALLQYSTDLCDATTAGRMAHHYANLLRSILAQPDARVSQLDLLDETERRQLLTINATPKAYPHAICVHELFRHQAAKTPDKMVAVDARGTLTYRELNAQSDQLANLIRGLTR